MTNQEMILAYNGIMQFQNMEQKKFEESGKKILPEKFSLLFQLIKIKAAIVQALHHMRKRRNQSLKSTETQPQNGRPGRKSKKLQRQKTTCAGYKHKSPSR